MLTFQISFSTYRATVPFISYMQIPLHIRLFYKSMGGGELLHRPISVNAMNFNQ